MKNLYDILQVSENASDEIIEKAYKTLVKKYHPDLQPKEKKQVAEAMMKSLNEAYEILSDPTKREKYDRERAEIRRQQEAEREAKLQKEQVYHTQERSVPRQEDSTDRGTTNSKRRNISRLYGQFSDRCFFKEKSRKKKSSECIP